ANAQLLDFQSKSNLERVKAINKYLEYMGKQKLRLKSIKVQQRSYLENVITNADYQFLKKKLKMEDNLTWYFVVRFLAATGARVSELIQLKVEHIYLGYYDIYTKGGKIRRIYIPKLLKQEAVVWLEEQKRSSGYIFLNRFGERITTRGISQQLKNYANKYGMNEKVVYPHSFRHRFAKNFLEKFNDISLLADLMGHESIETTRIYLRRSSSEQQAIIDKIITW
ncbi:tyrosine-type recombinase/integrase, partial [Bacteroides sp.]|uniref:tyrosine-type recombinase/integrase n=1 Tax=Bacteroides sp. TaxID=29523 RepID=UPI0025C67E66